MGKENFSKIKLLAIWEMLKADSDEQCPMSTNEIISKLKSKGIECDRRTLYADIAALNSFGYEVLCTKGQHCNLYYVVDRGFDVPELRIQAHKYFFTDSSGSASQDRISKSRTQHHKGHSGHLRPHDTIKRQSSC